MKQINHMNNIELMNHYLPSLAEIYVLMGVTEEVNQWSDEQYLTFVNHLSLDLLGLDDGEESISFRRIKQRWSFAITIRNTTKSYFLFDPNAE